MDWNKQMEQLVSSWTETQRKMWDSWLATVKQFSENLPEGAGGAGASYKANLEAWEKAVRQALEAQNEWAKRFSTQAGQQSPESMEQWSKQVQEMMKGWTESQQQLWDAWLSSMRKMDMSEMSSQWEKESRQVMEAWQQAAQRAQETMVELARVGGQQTGSGKPGGKGSGSAK
ncbi:hypothetical protein [Aquisalimonas sp.]|uniref:hypothetical protein n=1 Tax=Aquisalimonas sp. TaxID=1872621 RepID=UPI0025B99CD4|nr:hypothetical protein [Aquisalimonas sp.]